MKNFLSRLWRIVKRTFIILFIAQFVYIILLKWINPPITITQLASWIRGDGLKRDYISHENMPGYAKLAVIASEDQMFPDHNGFDFKSIKKAMAYNEKKPGRVKGASTISQQVAKNVFLWQGRNWFRKGLEVYFTFMIELIWGKKRILEVYMNVAEMGKGVFGIEACSRYNFKTPAKNLSRAQAAMIAASLPNPKAYTIRPRSRYVSVRYPWVMRQMNFLVKDPDVLKVIN